MTKEKILKSFYESFVSKHPNADFYEFETEALKAAFIGIIYPAMQEYADQETAALRAENDRMTAENAALKQQIEDMGEVIKELREKLQELKHPF